MVELVFNKDLYDGFALDEATKTYGRFGTFELVEEPARWVVRVTANSAEREERLSAELANHALGATIERWNTRQSGQAGAPPKAEG
jgi:hypothetical protein